VTEQPPTDEPREPETPQAETPAEAEAPAQAETPQAETPAEAEAPAQAEAPVEAPAPEAEAPTAPEAEAQQAPGAGERPEAEAPREKPAIPGADLEPDIVPEGHEALPGEEPEAGAPVEDGAAEPATAEPEGEQDVVEERPIAEVAIDLAKGATYAATGKRKSAVARVVLTPGSGAYTINERSLEVFFPRLTLQRVICQPLETVGYESRMDVTAKIHGGGVSSQAGALRHGIARALLEADPNLRGELKRRGFLTRDPRRKERKKAGLKKARKRPQFSKR